nr:NADH dehydrogenase subunit 4 [Linognathus africanus]
MVWVSSLISSFLKIQSLMWRGDELGLIMLWSLLWVLLVVSVTCRGCSIYTLMSSTFVSLFYLTSSWLALYFFYELAMLPILVMIVINSSKPERFLASQFLLFYTVFCSFPLLIVIMFFLNGTGLGLFMPMVYLIPTPLKELTLLAFMVKYPLFFLHNWLLKAHVEASLEGSMFLAGALLKLGPYGLIQLFLVMSFNKLFLFMVVSISLMGSVASAILSVFSVDLKLSVAYSSVSHMNMGIAGSVIFSMSAYWGVIGMIVAHSFASCVLFFMVTLAYELTGSRSPILIKGSFKSSPPLSFLGASSWLSNLNVPPFLGFVGELMVFMGLMKYSFVFSVFLCLYGVLGGFYCLLLYFIQCESKSSHTYGFNPCHANLVGFMVGLTPQLLLFLMSSLILSID